jgi:hypothetical protein
MTQAPSVIFKIPTKIPQPGRGKVARPAAGRLRTGPPATGRVVGNGAFGGRLPRAAPGR